ncbi:MAG: YIP1 family protein [Defluviitaleaceae bacterium]|nr:YIP1 family protein [Defluviitaleaceae bacterium]MCL2263603.1 YIP1 family protein [Defluviitaleaceae bacterium]
MTAIKKRAGRAPNSTALWFKNYLASLRYSLYTMRRPLDGFWDLIHEKRGSMAAAHTIVVLFVLVQIVYLTQTNFTFININMETFSSVFVVMNIVGPLLLFSLANWCLTTLFDGKGRISDIYMGYAYAMVPQLIIRAILTPLSHVVTYDEMMILVLMWYIGEYWFYLLILCAMKQIHDYSFGKAVITTILSLAAMGIMVFIFLMFFAVVSDGIAYFYSLGQEALFRMRRG